jgi:riboflavin kinase / FMN adenylyltransferase
MELIRGLHNLRERHRGCVLTLGNFDGMHHGHRALIARARQLATQHRLPLTVMSFEPLPREFFAPDTAPGRICELRDRLRLIEEQGVERLLLQAFNARFAAIEASAFVEQVLVAGLAVRAVVIGDDFRFGAQRAGDLALLRQLGTRHDFSAESLGSVQVRGERCSSTAVRAALAQPDLTHAAELLGRRYSISGRVRRGLQLGRKLDMPTANIALRRRPALRMGVYAVHARLGGRRWDGVASLGVRPTLNLRQCLLETHLFESPGDIYGRILEVEFVRHLRDERRFDSLEALAAQMQADKAQAMEILSADAP